MCVRAHGTHCRRPCRPRTRRWMLDAALPCGKRHSILNFPMLSPEPVLVKSSFLNMNGAKSGVFRTSSRNLSSRCRLDINAKQRSCPSAFPMLVPSLAW